MNMPGRTNTRLPTPLLCLSSTLGFQTNEQENQNLAQTPNLIIYDRLTNGKLLDEPDLWKIGNQLNTLVDQADNGAHGGRLFDTANTYCTRRYVSCPRVFAQNGSIVAYGNIIAAGQIDPEGITMEPIPSLEQVMPTNCTF